MLKTGNVYYYFILSISFIILSSCVSKKNIVYLNDGVSQSQAPNSYNTIFKPYDLLQITVSALDLDAVKPFNLPAVTYATTTNSVIGTPQQQSYLVDNKGYIEFPVIGKVKLGGLTRAEAIDLLKNKLAPDYIKNPTINIKISNFTITVLGDVKRPGSFIIPNERVTILRALGLAGDMNITGKRNGVLVEREVGNKKIEYRLDLRSNKIFNSPAYYLQQNDVVYVAPNKSKSQDAAYNKNTGLFVSLASLLVSLIAIFTR